MPLGVTQLDTPFSVGVPSGWAATFASVLSLAISWDRLGHWKIHLYPRSGTFIASMGEVLETKGTDRMNGGPARDMVPAAFQAGRCCAGQGWALGLFTGPAKALLSGVVMQQILPELNHTRRWKVHSKWELVEFMPPDTRNNLFQLELSAERWGRLLEVTAEKQPPKQTHVCAAPARKEEDSNPLQLTPQRAVGAQQSCSRARDERDTMSWNSFPRVNFFN